MIRIAGVPEHFNLPWHLAIEDGAFVHEGIPVQWTDVPEGTGKMCAMLREGETDIAVILTEGIVRDIVGGNPSSIVQVYVQSPLIWGIHVDAKSDYWNLSDLENAKVAISRKGSGSHLMAVVNAQQQGWNTSDLEFEIVNTIDGAVEALSSRRAGYFMWERFMTKPLVDSGTFRKIGDCPTPWPCFVIAVRNEILDERSDDIRKILNVVNRYSKGIKSRENITDVFASRYHQRKEDIEEWLSLTEWSQETPDADMLNKVQNQLLELSLIHKKGTFAEMVKAL